MARRRNRRELQIECCELTGRLVSAQRLEIATTEGLRGFAIGDTARWSRRVMHLQSFNDSRRQTFRPLPEARRLLPHGGNPWWRNLA